MQEFRHSQRNEYWDILALKIVSAIEPVSVYGDFDSLREIRTRPLHTRMATQATPSLQHPSTLEHSSSSPSHPQSALRHYSGKEFFGIEMCPSATAAEHQLVRYMGYEGSPAPLRVDWGRVQLTGMDGVDRLMVDIIVNVGCSGGPLIDGNGLLVGILSASHSSAAKLAYCESLHDLKDILCHIFENGNSLRAWRVVSPYCDLISSRADRIEIASGVSTSLLTRSVVRLLQVRDGRIQDEFMSGTVEYLSTGVVCSLEREEDEVSHGFIAGACQGVYPPVSQYGAMILTAAPHRGVQEPAWFLVGSEFYLSPIRIL